MDERLVVIEPEVGGVLSLGLCGMGTEGGLLDGVDMLTHQKRFHSQQVGPQPVPSPSPFEHSAS